MKKGRVEAFSDGVLAIILTIMVLELPRPEGHEWSSLTRVVPTLLAYILSFAFVGVYWNNHHHMFQAVRRVNGAVLWANLHLLFWLSLLPFVTDWAGESHFAPVPTTLYAADALLCGVAYTVLLRSIIRADPDNHLLPDAVGQDFKGKASVLAYVLAVVAPFFGQAGVWVAGACLVGVALTWIIPDRRIERVLTQEHGLPHEKESSRFM